MMGHTIIAVALAAFWGLARLGELLNDEKTSDFVRVGDIEWPDHGQFARIAIRNAKTARRGEIQHIHLQSQQSLLDPIGAINRLLNQNNSVATDPLFSFRQNGKLVILTKHLFIARVTSVLEAPAVPCPKGHSFRIGGALLLWNFKVDTDKLKLSGRWKSNVYRRYIRCYSDDELERTRQVLTVMKL